MDERIQIDPAICHGKPVIRGTRVLVSTILGALGGGDSIAGVLEDYPGLTEADIRAALTFGGGVVPLRRIALRIARAMRSFLDENFPKAAAAMLAGRGHGVFELRDDTYKRSIEEKGIG